MDWAAVLTIVGANIAVIIPMFLWIRSEANQDRRMFYQLLQEMKDDMRDFHGKLERQDAEFKAHLMHSHKEVK